MKRTESDRNSAIWKMQTEEDSDTWTFEQSHQTCLSGPSGQSTGELQTCLREFRLRLKPVVGPCACLTCLRSAAHLLNETPRKSVWSSTARAVFAFPVALTEPVLLPWGTRSTPFTRRQLRVGKADNSGKGREVAAVQLGQVTE